MSKFTSRIVALLVSASMVADPVWASLPNNLQPRHSEDVFGSVHLFQGQAVTPPVVASQTPPLGAKLIGVDLHKFPAQTLYKNGDYRIELLSDRQTYRLHDEKNGTSLDVVPAEGNNVKAFIANINGKPRDILDPQGNPNLYPYANRIKDQEYTWNGKTHELKTLASIQADANGHAIHGLVQNKPFKVVTWGIDEEGVYVTCSIDHQDDPDLLRLRGPGKYTVTHQDRKSVV